MQSYAHNPLTQSGANVVRTAAMRDWVAWITRPFDVLRKHHRDFVYGPVDDAVDAIIRELAPRLVKEIGEREIDEDVEEYLEGAQEGRFEALADMHRDPERGKSDDYNAGYEWGFENARNWDGRDLPSGVKRKVVRDQIREFRGEVTEQVVIDLMEKAWHVVSPAHTFKAIVQAVKKHGWKLGIGFALFEIFEHAVLPTVMIKLTGDPRMAVLGTIPIGEIIYAVGIRILGTPKDVDKFQEDGYLDWYEAKYGPVRLASLTRVASTHRKIAGLGDCYEANGRYFMNESLFGGDSGMRLVHGEVTGQGPLEGVNYGHAWVEDGNTVIDVSNGRNTRMPKALYYSLGNIEQNDNIHRYSASEFRRKVSQYKHWGPWDLQTSTGF